MSERHPLWELTRAQLLEFVREPAALFWVFAFPVLMAIGLGIAFRAKPPDKLRLVTQDARVAQLLAGDAELEVAVEPEALARQALARGRAALFVRASTHSPPRLELLFDPLSEESRAARWGLARALARSAGQPDPLAISEHPTSEPGTRYIDFLLPALLGMNIMGSALWGVGYAVVDTRARRLLKRLAATPMNRAHYLLSYILSRLIFLVLEIAVLVGFGRLAFDVVVRGGYLELTALTVLGSLSFSGIALLVAARPRRPEVASGWMNFVMLPMYFLSGSFFAWERFPEWMHPLIRALPLTALNDALRAVVNRGASFADLGVECLVLILWGAVSFTVALRIFRWQ